MPAYLTTADLAERWNCSRRAVQQLAHSRQIAALRLGSDWRFSTEAVEAYERANTTGPASEPRPARRLVRSFEEVDHGSAPAGYEPVFAGDVPWRSTVVAGKKKATLPV